MGRQIRLRVRPGRAFFGWNEAGTSFQHSTGDEFLISYEDAAKLLAGKGRRAFEIVEVIEEDEREDVPKVAFESEEQASD